MGPTARADYSKLAAIVHSPTPSGITPALVRDRLVDELLHLLAEVGALRARRLRHQHRGDLLLRIDPEIGAAVARPHVLARGTGNRGDAVGEAHREAEPESVALAAEEQHARIHRQVHRAAEMVRSHQSHGGILDGKRVLSRTTVRLMTSDHL